MTAVVTLPARDVALQLHALLKDLDPNRFRLEAAAAMRSKFAELEAAVAELLDEGPHKESWPDTLRSSLSDLRERLAEGLPDVHAPSADELRAEWMALRARLQPAYDELRADLRDFAVHLPTLRPTNYKRNVMHAGSGLLAVAIVAAMPMTWLLPIALGMAAFAWTCEISRRFSPRWNDQLMKVFAPVAHPHEWKAVNSATWYCTALVALAATGSLPLIAVGLSVMAFGDPAAALVGRRWGRIKLLHGRSLEGSLAFLVVGALAAFATLQLFVPQLGFAGALALASGGALVGALAEAVSLRVDDNLSVPLAASAGAVLAAWLIALPV